MVNPPLGACAQKKLMNKFYKIGAVILGYILAFLIACAVLWLSQGKSGQNSGGMKDFSDLLVSLGVFGVAALFPTGLCLYFLRRSIQFWKVLPIISSVVVISGLFSAFVIAFWSKAPAQSFWGILAVFSVFRLLAAPIVATGFAITAFISPNRTSRQIHIGATLIEGSVAIYAFVHWFVSSHLF